MSGSSLPGLPQQQLADSQFRALAESAPDAIVTATADGRVAYANPAAERLFGHPRASLIGQPTAVLMPDDLRPAHDAGFRRYVETGVGRLVGATVEVTAMDATGRRFPIELSLGSAGSGESRMVTAVIRDLTDRRRRERHLAAQLAVTRVLADARSSDETAPRSVEALTRALGWEVGALWLLGDDDRLRVHHLWQADPDVTSAFARLSRNLVFDRDEGLPGQALVAGRPVWHDDLSATSGFIRAEKAAAAGLRSAICLPLLSQGRATGVIECFAREVTPVDDELRDLLMTVASQVGEHLQRLRTEERLEAERRRFAVELARSNVELEHFAQVAAHDLQTPLRTISGFAEILVGRHGDLLDEEAREFLGHIIASAHGGARLLDRLLSYARVGSAHLRLDRVQTNDVVAEVVTALAADLRARDAEIRVQALPAVTADRVLLAQLLQNLLSNAVKFTPPGRRPIVHVRGSRQGAEVDLTVVDNGIGIAPAEAERLFEMFVRGAGGSGVEGSGIGLAVCAKIVERHGGRIWAEAARAQGTALHVLLPGADQPGSPQVGAAPGSATGRQSATLAHGATPAQAG